jgi:glyoxylase-like metal-dependent hydrolase (beta-lactamase superfamily II)
MILNTHSHADHVGGNKYLQDQTGCAVYAPGIEADFTNHPLLEPAFLYGGCPPKELRHKFLMAQESHALPLTEDVLPEGFEIIPLPGHSFDMVGFRAPDGVVYLADCLSGKETLDKYQVAFLYDVSSYLRTLETVKAMEASIFIPSHAEATDCIAPLAQYNIDKVLAIGEKICRLCQTPLCFEELLQRIFTEYALTMTVEQYALVGSTLHSYLTWLKESNRLTLRIEDNRLLWQAC